MDVGSCAKTCLRWLNAALIMAASASMALMLLLRRLPTPMGWAFMAVSGASVLSGILGFLTHKSRLCFALHAIVLLISVIGEGLGFLMLFSRAQESLRRLQPTESEKEAQILIRANAGLLMVMFCIQMWILVLACGLQYCVFEDYQGLDSEVKERANRKRSRKMARVQEESLAHATTMEELRAHDLNRKMKEKHGHWAEEDDEFGA